MKWKPSSVARSVRAAAMTALAVVACTIVGLASSAFAAGTSAGNAVTTNPATNASISSGGSATSWTLNLPGHASCSGDSATQGYHVYSFIVPAATDVGTLTFNPSTGPSSGNPLVDSTGSAYMAANTAVTTGQVIQIPTFDFNLFATTDMGGTKLALPPGDYKAGIACANTTGQGDKYWQTTFTFTANASDPNGEVWANRTTAADAGGNHLALPIGIAVVAGAGFVVLRRRRQRRTVSAA